MNHNQQGSFSIELVFVLYFISFFLAFTGDIALHLIHRGELDRVSYSLVNILKERERLYMGRKGVTNAEFSQLQSFSNKLLSGYSDAPATANHGLLVEWLYGSKDGDKTGFIDNKVMNCDTDKKLKNKAELIPINSSGRKLSIYRVTVCRTTKSWFNNMIDNSNTHYIRSSSIMPGRTIHE